MLGKRGATFGHGRLGLRDVLAPIAFPQQVQLRALRVGVRLRLSEFGLKRFGVEPCKHLARGNGIAFVDQDLRHPPVDAEGEIDLANIDIAVESQRFVGKD